MKKQHYVEFCQQKQNEIKDELSQLRGKTIVIISDYNGQEFGKSKRSLKGEKFVINHAVFGMTGELVVFIKEQRLGLLPEDWDFV